MIKIYFNFFGQNENSGLLAESESHFEGMDEGLDNYYNSFDGLTQKNYYARELYYRNKFGIKCVDDVSLEKIKNVKNSGNPDKIFTTVSSYNIIQGHFYYD